MQWQSAQTQQVQVPPATQPEKEVPLPPLNPEYAAYAFKKPFDSIEGGIVYQAPSGVNDSETTSLSSRYAMYAFKQPILDQENGAVYEAPCSDYKRKADEDSPRPQFSMNPM